MKITRFEDIIAWQKGQDLTAKLFLILKSNPDFIFKNQILRASLSIPNNIAEGFERQTNKELRQFLFIAKGSTAEVRSMLYTGKNLQYFSQEDFTNLLNLTLEISKMLSAFIKTL
jgi:four helix bundle protein